MREEKTMESVPGTKKYYELIKMIGQELEREQKTRPNYSTDAIHAAAEPAKRGLKLLEAAHAFNYQDDGKENMTGAALRVAAAAIRFLMNVDRLRVNKTRKEAADYPRVCIGPAMSEDDYDQAKNA